MQGEPSEAPRHACICTCATTTSLATPPTASGGLFVNNTWGNSTPLKHLYHRWHSGQHLSLQSSTPPTSFWRVLLHQHHRGDNAPHSSPPRWRSGVVFFIDSTEGNSVPLCSSLLMEFQRDLLHQQYRGSSEPPRSSSPPMAFRHGLLHK